MLKTLQTSAYGLAPPTERIYPQPKRIFVTHQQTTYNAIGVGLVVAAAHGVVEESPGSLGLAAG